MVKHLVVVVVLGGVAFAGVSKKKIAPPKEPDPVAAPVDDEPVDDEQAAELKKWRVPVPPSQNRAEYVAWKKKLPKSTRARIDKYCRHFGTEYRATCNGIGPLAIPTPPSLVKMKAPGENESTELGMTHEQWRASLTAAQTRYYETRCVPKHDEPTGEDLEFAYTQLCGGTPLVLSFDNARVNYEASSTGPSDWPTTATPWLALDRDGDGAITSAAELFGGETRLPSGRAKHGFEALAALDDNHDGIIDAQDAAFAKLVVWADANGDRQSSADELVPLSAREGGAEGRAIMSLSLGYRREPFCDERMNCEGERAPMQWRDANGVHTGTVVDVYLRYR
jgi:hypothetical protein